MNSSKLVSPLILVDPVDPERNVTSALSEDNYKRFIDASIGFVKAPLQRYLLIKSFDIGEFKGFNIKLKLNIKKPLKEDVAGAKALKIFKAIENEIIKKGFEVLDKDWHFNKKDKAFFFFKIPESIQPEYIFEGPPLTKENHVKRFKSKHKKTFIKDGKIYAKEPRLFNYSSGLLDHLLNKFSDEDSGFVLGKAS
jgi:tRNA nucleotidyltransferase (CCA-adding enzyme)